MELTDPICPRYPFTHLPIDIGRSACLDSRAENPPAGSVRRRCKPRDEVPRVPSGRERHQQVIDPRGTYRGEGVEDRR